jgi:glycosyltransferase involved in cell wall biosynthesis
MMGQPSGSPPVTLKPITIVIPAYNEAEAIEPVLNRLKTIRPDLVEEIIVVNDGSTDQTAERAQLPGIRVVSHSQNRGYGAALKTGIIAAQTPFVVTMDSDGQHNPADVERLWAVAASNDMVVGQRTAVLHSQLWRMPGKWLLTLMANYLSRRRIPDLNSGFRLMRRDVVKKYMHLCPSGFSFSTTITMAFFNRGHKVDYVPIQVEKRTGKSTVSVRTGFETIILVLRLATLFDPLRVFIPLSIFFGIAGFSWGIPYALAGYGLSVGAMLAFVTALLMFTLGLVCDQVSQLRLERYE